MEEGPATPRGKRGLQHPKGCHPPRQAGQLLPTTHSCMARELRIPFTFLNVGGVGAGRNSLVTEARISVSVSRVLPEQSHTRPLVREGPAAAGGRMEGP